MLSIRYAFTGSFYVQICSSTDSCAPLWRRVIDTFGERSICSNLICTYSVALSVLLFRCDSHEFFFYFTRSFLAPSFCCTCYVIYYSAFHKDLTYKIESRPSCSPVIYIIHTHTYTCCSVQLLMYRRYIITSSFRPYRARDPTPKGPRTSFPNNYWEIVRTESDIDNNSSIIITITTMIMIIIIILILFDTEIRWIIRFATSTRTQVLRARVQSAPHESLRTVRWL